MAKKSGGELKPWLTAKQDCKEKRFIQVGNSLLLDKRYQRLSTGAKCLYQCMCMESAGKREFQFPHGAAKKYGIASSSFDRQSKELQQAGFIEKIEDGNYAQYAPAVYRFSLLWRTKPAPQFGEGK